MLFATTAAGVSWVSNKIMAEEDPNDALDKPATTSTDPSEALRGDNADDEAAAVNLEAPPQVDGGVANEGPPPATLAAGDMSPPLEVSAAAVADSVDTSPATNGIIDGAAGNHTSTSNSEEVPSDEVEGIFCNSHHRLLSVFN